MIKHLYLLFIISLFSICKAQEFSFQLKFIDAIGNTDSVTLGYDLTATNAIDPEFAESNHYCPIKN